MHVDPLPQHNVGPDHLMPPHCDQRLEQAPEGEGEGALGEGEGEGKGEGEGIGDAALRGRHCE